MLIKTIFLHFLILCRLLNMNSFRCRVATRPVLYGIVPYLSPKLRVLYWINTERGLSRIFGKGGNPKIRGASAMRSHNETAILNLRMNTIKQEILKTAQLFRRERQTGWRPGGSCHPESGEKDTRKYRREWEETYPWVCSVTGDEYTKQTARYVGVRLLWIMAVSDIKQHASAQQHRSFIQSQKVLLWLYKTSVFASRFPGL